MTVQLSIENDAELRSYIKECIKGQVLSIVREEFLEMVKEELNRKLKAAEGYQFDKVFKDGMETCIKDLLKSEHDVSAWNTQYIYPVALPVVIEAVTQAVSKVDWQKSVNELANDKINKIINAQ